MTPTGPLFDGKAQIRKPLLASGQYIEVRPDGMVAVQEWHMASDGMDTYHGRPPLGRQPTQKPNEHFQ